MALQTQGLEVQQVRGLRVAGEAAHGLDVVRFRGRVRDPSSALTATAAVTKQGPRFEVHAPRPLPTFVLTNFGFPINVIQVASRARVIRFGRFLLPRQRKVLRHFSAHSLRQCRDYVRHDRTCGCTGLR